MREGTPRLIFGNHKEWRSNQPIFIEMIKLTLLMGLTSGRLGMRIGSIDGLISISHSDLADGTTINKPLVVGLIRDAS